MSSAPRPPLRRARRLTPVIHLRSVAVPPRPRRPPRRRRAPRHRRSPRPPPPPASRGRALRVQHALVQPVVHERVEELHRPLDGLDEDEQRRPQPAPRAPSGPARRACRPRARRRRSDCSTVSAAAFFSPTTTWTGQHRVHQVLDRGRHRRREEAALHRRAIVCGEHLVALLEEPELEQLVVQHQVLEGRERQRALAAATPSRSGVHTITSYRRQMSVDKPTTTTTTTTPTPPPRSA